MAGILQLIRPVNRRSRLTALSGARPIAVSGAIYVEVVLGEPAVSATVAGQAALHLPLR